MNVIPRPIKTEFLFLCDFMFSNSYANVELLIAPYHFQQYFSEANEQLATTLGYDSEGQQYFTFNHFGLSITVTESIRITEGWFAAVPYMFYETFKRDWEASKVVSLDTANTSLVQAVATEKAASEHYEKLLLLQDEGKATEEECDKAYEYLEQARAVLPTLEAEYKELQAKLL